MLSHPTAQNETPRTKAYWSFYVDRWLPEIVPLKDEDGKPLEFLNGEGQFLTITYPGDDPEGDETDASPADVIAWLKQSR